MRIFFVVLLEVAVLFMGTILAVGLLLACFGLSGLPTTAGTLALALACLAACPLVLVVTLAVSESLGMYTYRHRNGSNRRSRAGGDRQ